MVTRKEVALLVLLITQISTLFCQDVPYHNQQLGKTQDIGAINQNFRDLSDRKDSLSDGSVPSQYQKCLFSPRFCVDDYNGRIAIVDTSIFLSTTTGGSYGVCFADGTCQTSAGVGSSAISINASQFTGDGTLASPLTLISSSVTLQGNTFNGANQLLKTDSASKLLTGNLPADGYSGTYASLTGSYYDPAWITSLSTSKIDLSTVAPSVIASLLSSTQTFTGYNTFTGSVTINSDPAFNSIYTAGDIESANNIKAGGNINVGGDLDFGTSASLDLSGTAIRASVSAAPTTGKLTLGNAGPTIFGNATGISIGKPQVTATFPFQVGPSSFTVSSLGEGVFLSSVTAPYFVGSAQYLTDIPVTGDFVETAGDTMTGHLGILYASMTITEGSVARPALLVQISTEINTSILTANNRWGGYFASQSKNNVPSGTGRIATSVYGESFGSGNSFGVRGKASGSAVNYGIYGSAINGTTNWAGYFDGDVNIVGTATFSGAVIGVHRSSSTAIGAWSGSASTFVTCIATVTITTYGGRVMVGFTGNAASTSASYDIYTGFMIDGTYPLGQSSTIGMARATYGVTDTYQPLGFTTITDTLSAGSHSFCVGVWGTPVGTVALDTTTSAPRFWVMEMP